MILFRRSLFFGWLFICDNFDLFGLRNADGIEYESGSARFFLFLFINFIHIHIIKDENENKNNNDYK